MPVTDISSIHSTVIALNYLNKEEQELTRKHWDSRFANNTVFWIEAKGCSIPEIKKRIQDAMVEQGITNMMGVPCIFVYLLDTTQADFQEQIHEIWDVTTSLRKMLLCQVQLVLQYGYVGVIGMESVAVQRKNIGWLCQRNAEVPAAIQHRFCMIAKPVLMRDGGNSWKAAMVLLDILRRSTDPTSLLPEAGDGIVNNDVGFLRYAEYDKTQFQMLQNELNEVTEKIDAHNGDKVKEAVVKLLDDHRQQMLSKYVIHAEYHPQHTNMVVVNSGLLKHQQKQAAKGRNTEYNQASEATLAAVKSTADRMHKEITAFYSGIEKKADQWLKTTIQNTKVSCDVRLSASTMRSMLQVDLYQQRGKQMPHLMELKYSVAGCQTTIDNYLVETRDYAIYQGEQALVNALWAAFEKIDPETIQKERALLEQKQGELKLKLQNLPTESRFATQMTNVGYDLPESQFFPISAGGDSRKHLLVRGQEMLNVVNAAGVNALWIHEFAGGLETLDSAPMKAVQYVTRNYSEEDMDQLLPEEN